MRAVSFAVVMFAAFTVSPSGPPLAAISADEDEGWLASGASALPPDPPVPEPDEAQVLAELERVAPAAASGVQVGRRERGEFERRRSQQFKVQMLGWENLKARQYRAAYLCFTRWEPVSDCGTCLGSMNEERKYLILNCRLHAGEQAAVARELLHALLSGEYIETESVMILFRLYQEAGQIDDLLRLLDHSVHAKQNEDVRRMLHIRRLIGARDVAALIKLCQDSGNEAIECGRRSRSKGYYAANALVRLLGRNVSPVLNALGVPNTGANHWLLYVLGKSGSPAALKWLAACARRHDSGEGSAAVAFAIMLHGTAGSDVLTELASHDNSLGREMEWRLKYFPQFDLLERAWPPPNRGSLPAWMPPA